MSRRTIFFYNGPSRTALPVVHYQPDELHSMHPVGIEMRLSRDLISKYTSNPEIREIVQSHVYAWQSIGQFDFLQIRPLTALSNVSQQNGGEVSDVAIGAHSGILAFPFFPSRPSDAVAADGSYEPTETGILGSSNFREFASLVAAAPGKQANPASKDFPVLLMARICLAPVPFEFTDHFYSGIEAIDAARALIIEKMRQETLKLFPPVTAILRGLSSAELVVIMLPQCDSQILSAGRLFRWMSTISIETMFQKLMDDKQHRLPGKLLIDPRNLKGHAFASVTTSLAFRVDQATQFHWEEPGCDDERIDFHFGIRGDAGHQVDISRHLTDLLKAPNNSVDYKIQFSFDRFEIRGRLSGLKNYVDRFWASTWKDYYWKCSHLIDTVTTICFDIPNSNEEPGHSEGHGRATELVADNTSHEPAWQLTEEVDRELQQIVNNVSSWATSFLASTQRYELVNSVRTVQSCFLHHELASSARDLMPFLRQLSLVFSAENYALWQAFRENADPESISEDISAMLIHLHRAVRNRLEQREAHADPTMPHTLEHGASKLVNAYTTAFWMCAELLSGKSSKPQLPTYCNAEHLSVCVAAGYEGKVSCREAFYELRRFVEAGGVGGIPAGRLSQLEPNGWSSRLLLLEVSGQPMFHPELSVVHALHEAGEFSEWATASGTKELRLRVNLWLESFYMSRLLEYTEEFAGPGASRAMMYELQDFLQAVLRVAVVETWKSNSDASGSSIEATEQLAEQLHPREYNEVLRSAICNSVARIETWENARCNTIAAYSYVRRIPLLARACIDFLRPKVGQLQHPMDAMGENLGLLIVELLADVSMWSGFLHIAKLHSQRVPSQQERIIWANMIFSSVFDAFLSRAGEGLISKQALSLVLKRWVFHLAFLTEGDNWVDAINQWLNSSRNEDLLESLRKVFSVEGETWTLQGELKNIAQNNIHFISENMFSLRSLLRYGNPAFGGIDCPFPIEGYEGSVEPGITTAKFGFPTAKELSPAEQALWLQFWRTWTLRTEISSRDMVPSAAREIAHQLARAQVDMVFQMWAKSTRFRFKQAYSRVRPTLTGQENHVR